MAGEGLLNADGFEVLNPAGQGILVPAGGLDVIDACCCLEDPPNCTCRRMYTGLNTIYQQDQYLIAPEYELLSLYDPVYSTGFTSSSNSVDTNDDPGAHRCFERVICISAGPGGGGGAEEEEGGEYPVYQEFCISCTDPASPSTLARPCGWYMNQSLGDVCIEIGEELKGPTWTWIGRNPFKPIELNHCISSSIDAGTLEEAENGGTDRCGVGVLRWCPAPGNQLKVTLTVGAQSLVVWGRWIQHNEIHGYWFYLDTDPSLPGIAWTALPYHKGTVVGRIKLVCNGDDTGTLTIQPNRAPPPTIPGCPACWGGIFDWVDDDDIAFLAKSWTIDLNDPSFTISDLISPETFLGGDGDPAVPLTILGEWLTIV